MNLVCQECCEDIVGDVVFFNDDQDVPLHPSCHNEVSQELRDVERSYLAFDIQEEKEEENFWSGAFENDEDNWKKEYQDFLEEQYDED